MMCQRRNSITMQARNNLIIQDIGQKEEPLDFSQNKNIEGDIEEATVQEIEIQINEVNVTETYLNFIGQKNKSYRVNEDQEFITNMCHLIHLIKENFEGQTIEKV